MDAARHGEAAERLLAGGRPGAAIRSFRRALRREPSSAWWMQGLAVAVARKGWFVAARSFFARAQALGPEEVARWFEAHPWEIAPPVGPAISDPVFVLGCPHSGTTLLTHLISSAPGFRWAEGRETHLFTRPPEEVGRRLEAWDAESRSAGGARWVEKSPTHSFLVPWIRRARPGARFVVVVRDGRDVFCSTRARGDHRGSEALVEQWLRTNRLLATHRDDESFFFVRYEDLVLERDALLREIVRHLGAGPSTDRPGRGHGSSPAPQMRSPDPPPTGNVRRSHWRHRIWQVRQPLFDGRGRWRHEMSAEEVAAFEMRAGGELAAFGYPVGGSESPPGPGSDP